MSSKNLQQPIRIPVIVLIALLLCRSFDLRRRQHVAFQTRLLQFIAKNETVSRSLVGDHYFCIASRMAPRFQIFDHLSSPRTTRRKSLSLGRLSIQRDLVHKRLVMRVTSNENVVQASSPYRCLWFFRNFLHPNVSFLPDPAGTRCPLLHGELL